MKATYENIIRNDVKPEDFEYEFGWILSYMKYKNGNEKYELIYNDVNFMPSWYKFFNSDYHVLSDAAKTCYKSKNWKPMIEALRDAISKLNSNMRNHISGDTLDELKQKIKDFKMEKIVSDIDSMECHEYVSV